MRRETRRIRENDLRARGYAIPKQYAKIKKKMTKIQRYSISVQFQSESRDGCLKNIKYYAWNVEY